MALLANLFRRSPKIPPIPPIGSSDGEPLKILVRGDCTSMRSMGMNQDMFGQPPTIIQNQKSLFVQFLDAERGVTVSPDYLEELSDTEPMPTSLRRFYMGQADRSILSEGDADLLVLDTWGEVNFELFEHRVHGFKLWVNRKFVRDLGGLERDFVKLGRRTFDESVDDAVAFIDLVRQKNPGIPVLFLHQQVDFYPRLPEKRTNAYRSLAERVSERREGVYVGGALPRALVEPDALGSAGGPGGTLHFQPTTYRRMWGAAAEQGLVEAVNAYQAQRLARRGRTTTPPDRQFDVVDSVTVSPQLDATCSDTLTAMTKVLERYVTFAGRVTAPTGKLSFTPMLIDLNEHQTFEEWEQSVKKFGKGARLRQKRKALELEYYTHEYHPKLHVPDVYEINVSMDTRSGGPIRDTLKRNIDELGGYPSEHYAVTPPPCPQHWRRTFGVFQEAVGHRQGDFVTGEKMVGLISFRRFGEIAVYTQFIGHGAHLRNGVMTLLHHDLVERIFQGEDESMNGIRYVMYGGAQNGTSELFRFKRQAGFKAYDVDVTVAAGTELASPRPTAGPA